MKCPVCANTNLVMSERQGIEIDYCPECRGVWLDRGELDKILERSSAREAAPAQASQPAPQPAYRHPQPAYPHQQPAYQHQQPQYHSGHGHGHKPYRKKSFLEELFD